MDLIDPRQTPFVPLKSRGDLPHLFKPGGLYFVTFRLADAVVPREERFADLDSSQCHAPQLELNDFDPEELVGKYVPPITLGSCALNRPEIARLVQNAFLYFEGQRYELGTWCVMANHVHVIFAPAVGHSPSAILQSWKGFTAREANRILGTRGTFWERESFDHLIRSLRSFERLGNYVEMNPVKAGLCKRPEDWPFGSAGSGFQSRIWWR